MVRLRTAQYIFIGHNSQRYRHAIPAIQKGDRVRPYTCALLSVPLAILFTTESVANAQAVVGVSGESVRAVVSSARRSVFKVEAGLSHGTGFLIDSTGLVVTNDHVVGGGPASISVYVDSVTRVQAEVVARDRWLDLALLRIAPAACRECPPLHWSAVPKIQVADPVVVLGYPLSQPLTVTVGIVSAMRERALLTDANINPGNSGGPVLSMDGTVVAVATFGDQEERNGPGLGGAVFLSGIEPLLAKAREAPASMPSTRKLPIVPRTPIPIAALAAKAATVDPALYDLVDELHTGPFDIAIVTPLSIVVHQTRADAEVEGDRRKREQAAGVAAEERYSDSGELREWVEYIGYQSAPVVVIRIEPRIDETGGSSLRRAFISSLAGGDGGQGTLRFQGDVRGATLRRNGEVVEPLGGGHGPMRVDIENVEFQLKDVADIGYYYYSPETFRPDGPQKPPTIEIEVLDLKAPKKTRRVTLSPVFIARAWNDFELVYERQGLPFMSYKLTKSCRTTDAAGAMLGGSTVGTSQSAVCEYILTPPVK